MNYHNAIYKNDITFVKQPVYVGWATSVSYMTYAHTSSHILPQYIPCPLGGPVRQELGSDGMLVQDKKWNVAYIHSVLEEEQ